MTRIRHISISNFRCIKSLNWYPRPGINCLIGPGDSGKSTILDAIDACLSARRTVSFSDADFHGLDVSQPVVIRVTLGDLPDSLKDIDTYGDYLRGYDDCFECVKDEPSKGCETVLTVQLTVGADLEPMWRLYSDRTAALDNPRSLPFKERSAMAPARLGSHPSSNLSWTRGSVLNRLSEEKTDVGEELVKAARDARIGFGDKAGLQVADTLGTVTRTAQSLGIDVGSAAKALLDAHAVSFGDGAVALHSEAGIPLRHLGTGSVRLLLAGLHREAAPRATVLLVDEVEFGLEPHRLTRLLHSLGSKDKEPALQVFMTTHSPVAVRELSGAQLHVQRKGADAHVLQAAGTSDDIQGTLRCDPEAFLAKTVIVCEGASEIGLVRGFDLYFSSQGHGSLQAFGAAFVNANGGSPDKCLQRALALRKLGYRVIAFIDNDKTPSQPEVDALEDLGGYVVTWRDSQALEDVLFRAFPVDVIDLLISTAVEYTSVEYMDENLRQCSKESPVTLQEIRDARDLAADYSVDHRGLLGRAARVRKRGWFKSITKMEDVARDILGPHWLRCSSEFQDVVRGLYNLCRS